VGVGDLCRGINNTICIDINDREAAYIRRVDFVKESEDFTGSTMAYAGLAKGWEHE
jgi:hypothetical protein